MKLFFSSYILHFLLFFIVIIQQIKDNNIAKTDILTDIVDKYDLQQKHNDNTNKKNINSKKIGNYNGEVGDKNSSNIKLDVSIFNEKNLMKLKIKGKNMDDKNTYQTTLKDTQNGTKFIIDIYSKDKQKKIYFKYYLPLIVKMHYGLQEKGFYRIVLNFQEKKQILNQNATKTDLVITLQNKQNNDKIKSDNAVKSTNDNVIQNNDVIMEDNFNGLRRLSKNASFKYIENDIKKPIIVAIDAGHGGIDPGTIGKRKMPEKTITLMYARRLKEILENKGIKTILTRSTDKTIALAKRVQIAGQNNANIFISLHVDSHNNAKIHGTTIYRLSHLNENHPDWEKFRNKDYLPSQYKTYLNDKNNNNNVLDMLISMTHQSLLEKSSILTNNLLLEFEKNGICRACRHGQQSFAVLRGLDMTSILIEIGYITNQEEEKKILSASNVEKFCQIVANTILKTYNRKEKIQENANNKKNTKIVSTNKPNVDKPKNIVQTSGQIKKTTLTKTPQSNNIKNINTSNKNIK